MLPRIPGFLPALERLSRRYPDVKASAGTGIGAIGLPIDKTGHQVVGIEFRMGD